MTTPALHFGGTWSVTDWKYVDDGEGGYDPKPVEFGVGVTDSPRLQVGDHLVVTSRKGKRSEVRVREYLGTKEWWDHRGQHFTDCYAFKSLAAWERIWDPQPAPPPPPVSTDEDDDDCSWMDSMTHPKPAERCLRSDLRKDEIKTLKYLLGVGMGTTDVDVRYRGGKVTFHNAICTDIPSKYLEVAYA